MLGTVVLLAMRSIEGDKFQQRLHLSSAEGAIEGGSRHTMRQLRMQRVCLK